MAAERGETTLGGRIPYADVDMNVLKAAQVLSVHPNTIYARLQRIADISGLDARSLHPLIDLLIVCDCIPRAAT